MTDLTPTKTSPESGQSLVEFALLALFLMVILAGVLDLGRLYFTYLALHSAAGEGSSYAAVHPTWIEHGPNAGDPKDPNTITFRVQNESTGNTNLVNWEDTIVQVDAPTTEVGQPITVTVSFTYTVMTPVIQAITGETIPLRATSVQIIIANND